MGHDKHFLGRRSLVPYDNGFQWILVRSTTFHYRRTIRYVDIGILDRCHHCPTRKGIEALSIVEQPILDDSPSVTTTSSFGWHES